MSDNNGPSVYVPPEHRDEMLRLINANRRAAGLLPQEYPGHDPYAETTTTNGETDGAYVSTFVDTETGLIGWFCQTCDEEDLGFNTAEQARQFGKDHDCESER